MRSILQIGNYPILRTVRAAVLRLTGASVVTASSDEAMDILRREHFDLLIFCHTISEQERERISFEARKLHIDIRVLKVLRLSATSSGPDEALADPTSLLAKVNDALQKARDEQQSSH